MQLEHLTYTGSDLATVGIAFNDDLTILWGGSNTGKTYTVATLNFMFGGETPETPPEDDKYESALLGISFADGTSVIRRLAAIEEGGFLLQRFEDQPCPLCGALPGHQHKPHPLGDVDLQLTAARAEIAKIRRDMSDLEVTMASLTAEAEGLENRGRTLGAEARGHFEEIQRLRPREANLRTGYTGDVTLFEEIDRVIALSVRRSDRDAKRAAIAAIKHGKQKAAGLKIGIDGPTGHKFAQTVKKVLDAWGSPGSRRSPGMTRPTTLPSMARLAAETARASRRCCIPRSRSPTRSIARPRGCLTLGSWYWTRRCSRTGKSSTTTMSR